MYHTQAAAASTTTPEPNGQAQKAASATNTAASPTTSPSISGKSKKRSKSKSKSSGQKSASSGGSNTSSNASSEEKEPGALPNNDPSLDTKEGENRKDKPPTCSAATSKEEPQHPSRVASHNVTASTSLKRREPSTLSDGSGSKPKRPRSLSINKDLAQLGLGSFGNAIEDDSGMRRSRRAPNGSPDPKHKHDDSHPNEHAADQRASKLKEFDAGVSGLQNSALMRETSMEDAAYAQEAAEAKLDPEEGDEGITRCVCGSTDENVSLMIQCEMCMCWQHCICMGMQYEEDCPDVYFCEECKPELHVPLLRSLGLLPQSRNNKKGSKHSSKCSARELNQAKESTAALAQANARRNQNEASTSYATPSSSREHRQGSHSEPESESKQQIPKSPKRRSTMNSRDSAYGGWELMPPGLLNEGKAWETNDAPSAAQEDRRPAQKRKRGSTDDVDNKDSTLTPDPTDETSASAAEVAKRHRMSAGGSVQPGEAVDEAGASEDHGAEKEETSTMPSKSSKSKKKNSGHSSARDASVPEAKPQHPNQYTYRNKNRNAVSVGSGAAVKGGSTSVSTLMSHSPSPGPSKSRGESVRRSARDSGASRTGTPAPGNSNSGGNSGSSRLNNPGAPWGVPDHLAHLAYLLPISVSKPQNTHANGSKLAMPSSSNERQAAANTSTMATPRHVSARSSLPHPYSVVSAIEATTKVRFPNRRMTLAEMQRRVRNIGEYVMRSQIEAVDRVKRMRLLSIVPDCLKEDEGQGADNDDNKTNAGGALGKPEGKGDATSPAMASTAQQPPLPPSSSKALDTAMAEGEGGATAAAKAKLTIDNMPLSMRLMEELTRELIYFQRRFGTGPGAYGSFSGDGSSGSTSVAA
ncbi:hypothetical protein ACQY0O_000011 [Thecaphora frezii]